MSLSNIVGGSVLGIGVILLIVAFIMLSPLLTLWALNTLSEQAKFGWYIPHGFWTYLSVWALMLVFGRNSGSK